ncbi:MAG: VTT domain-containing protein [Chroococcidiopsidaceae cyanobacterium CP_BM_RX_35]|nr:VTT domain-containing protein [Chroococcidiopsidaceae cyanobacterium CP_BM_RX_35]
MHLSQLLEPQYLLREFGYLGLLAIIFSESCFLFFLPGDSLLFTAGFLAYKGLLNIWILMIGTFICAVLGNNVGYVFGARFGRRLFQGDNSWLFQKKHLLKAQRFYEKQGGKTIVIARFMPIVRTFAPVVAGLSTMPYQVFLKYNIIGGFLWTFGMVLLGYCLGLFLGKVIDVDKFLLPIIVVIVIISLIPSVLHFYQEKKHSRR